MINLKIVDFANISNSIPSMNSNLKLSRESRKVLGQLSASLSGVKIKGKVKVEVEGKRFELPADFAKALLAFAQHVEVGESLQVVSVEEKLTTQQAADYLGYSRPTLIKLLDEYEVQITKVGRHRKIPFSELLKLENKIKSERQRYLMEMAREDYKLGKLEGFDPVKRV